MKRALTLSKLLDIKTDIQNLTIQMRILERVNPRRPASQTIAVAAVGYAILVHALVPCAAQSLLERAPVEL